MGAWGTGNFENDDALDWVYRLDNEHDTSVLTETFEELLSAADQPESPLCCEALAAAEVLAALAGKSQAEELPEGVQSYLVRVKEKPTAGQLQLAGNAVERIRHDSELLELWKEEDQDGDWAEVIANLLVRLA